MDKNSSKKGFTIVEFMFAISFIGTLLIAITALTIQVARVYQKGLTMRALNTVSKEILDDLDLTIRGSSRPSSNDINVTGSNLNARIGAINANYYFQYSSNLGDATQAKTPISGMFCTHGYTYFWNTPRADGTNKKILVNGRLYRFARFSDYGCEIYKGYYLNHPNISKMSTSHMLTGINGNVDLADSLSGIPSVSQSDVYDIIGSTKGEGIDMALYDFNVQPAYMNDSTDQVIYNISFILGTVYGGINIMANGDYCKGEEANFLSNTNNEFSSSGLEYCSVNRFEVTIQQSGEKSL